MSEKTLLHVEGMTCANCASTITRALEKEGLNDVNVNYLTTEVTFEEVDPDRLEKIKSRINSIGYKVAPPQLPHQHHHSDSASHHHHEHTTPVLKKFIVSLVFTVPLLLHMFIPVPALHNPLVQLVLCLPVLWIGITFFGKSAWGSVKTGALNMDVLVFIGAVSAFVYSIIGMWYYSGSPEVHQYLFFETSAAIITFVLLGNVLEQRSVKQTTSAIRELNKLQPRMAKKVLISGDGSRQILEINSSEITKGDLIFVGTGDSIPVDGEVTEGSAAVNESMITGESLPVPKSASAKVTGGTLVEDGSITVRATAVGGETTLSRIIRMVSDAQLAKPEIQRLGDRISNVFVPIVLVISLATFFITYFILNDGLQAGIMRAIAVLVISCPCAMGLATPTALMVGIGRAAKNGILIKGGTTIEQFAKIKTIVFDKTGTLTQGRFTVRKLDALGVSESEAKAILFSLEQHSNHPVAKSLVTAFENEAGRSTSLKWVSVSEDKGVGINATDSNGNLYSAGSYLMARHATKDDSHSIYLLRNNQLIATLDLEDEIKSGAAETILQLNEAGIRTILLSGDKKSVCEQVARKLNLSEVFSEQLPKQKLEIIGKLSKEGLTAMVGDGINDSPALAKADVGVSLSDASQVAIQSAQIVLLHSNDLTTLLQALAFSRKTLSTIRQNLFWAFAYNVVAIPIAAAGFLSPAISALSMAFSDAILVGNSVRLRYRKIG